MRGCKRSTAICLEHGMLKSWFVVKVYFWRVSRRLHLHAYQGSINFFSYNSFYMYMFENEWRRKIQSCCSSHCFIRNGCSKYVARWLFYRRISYVYEPFLVYLLHVTLHCTSKHWKLALMFMLYNLIETYGKLSFFFFFQLTMYIMPPLLKNE